MNVLKLGLVVLGMVSLVASAFAAQGFSVSSARDFITVQAGSSAEFFANVKNVTTTPLNYGTYISYIEMFNDGAIPFDVTPKNGSIASGREALLKLSIPVPRNAFNGVYVVDLYVSSQVYEPSAYKFKIEVVGGVDKDSPAPLPAPPAPIATPQPAAPAEPQTQNAPQETQPVQGSTAPAPQQNTFGGGTATALAQLATPSQNKFFIWVFLGMTAGVMLVAFVSSLVRRYEFERQQKEYEFIKARALNDAKALS